MTSQLRILIIDDDIYITDSLAEYLEIKGFEVDVAGNGEEGLQYFDLCS